MPVGEVLIMKLYKLGDHEYHAVILTPNGNIIHQRFTTKELAQKYLKELEPKVRTRADILRGN